VRIWEKVMVRVFREKRSYWSLKLVIFVAVCAAILALVVTGASSLEDSSRTEGVKVDREAFIRAAVQCYALEGRYPPDVDYLEENYGLTLDRDKYVYHYRPVGENMMPQIELFPVTD
jgi:hypothetical protein